MSARPRTPRYFPRMKVRGARRRRMAPVHRVQRAFEELARDALAAAVLMREALATAHNETTTTTALAGAPVEKEEIES